MKKDKEFIEKYNELNNSIRELEDKLETQYAEWEQVYKEELRTYEADLYRSLDEARKKWEERIARETGEERARQDSYISKIKEDVEKKFKTRYAEILRKLIDEI